MATLKRFLSKWPFSFFLVSLGENRISQGVDDWGSLISVPQALRFGRHKVEKVLELRASDMLWKQTNLNVCGIP